MNDFTFGAIAGGVIGAAWSKVQRLFAWLTGLLIVRVEVGGQLLAQAVEWYCWEYMRHTRSPFYHYEGHHIWVRREAAARTIVSERAGHHAQLFWRGWRPLLLGAQHQQPSDRNSPKGLNPTDGGIAAFSFIRGTFNADKLLLQIMSAYEANVLGRKTEHNCRFNITRFSGLGGMRARMGDHGGSNYPPIIPNLSPTQIQGRMLGGLKPTDVGPPLIDGAPLSRIALSPSAQIAVDDIRRWAKSRAWYSARQIAWRRGMLLHGAPGTGKSSLVRGLAQELDWPVCVFDLSTMSNNELSSHWASACTLSPCVILFEDLDAVFNGRKNTLGDQGGGLTFDCLLNVLSGVGQADGLLVVITTNNREVLDPAISGGGAGPSRPGRVDLVVEMTTPDLEGRKLIAQNILVDRPDIQAQLVREGEGLSGAQFQELCINAALTDYWNNHVSIACGSKDPLIITRGR